MADWLQQADTLPVVEGEQVIGPQAGVPARNSLVPGRVDIEVEFALRFTRLEDVVDRAGQNHLLEAVDGVKGWRLLGRDSFFHLLTTCGHVLLVRHVSLSFLAGPY